MSKATSPVAFTPRGVNKNSFDALKMYLADMSDDEEDPDNDGEEDDSSGILVTESIVLEATGEESCTNVTQLILRDRRVSAFDPECASQLCALRSLSLSHNRIATLNPEHFGGGNNLFAGLKELNLNFNHLTSSGLLGGLLVAPHLTKLFLSSNRLDDSLFGRASSSTVGFARRFPKLSSLCLFKNALADLGLCLAELAQLPKLKELDLDGNPFCEEAAAPVTVPTTARTMGDGGGVSAGWYRHTVVRSLGLRLSLLDGEPVGALDRNLAAAFFNQHQEQAAEAAAAAGASSSASIIPSPRIGFGGGRGGAGGEEAGGGFAAGVGSSFDWSDLPSDSDDDKDDSDGDDCDQEDVGSGGGYGGGYGVGGGGGCSGRRSSTTTATNKNSAKSSHVLLGYLATDALGLTPRMQSPPSPSSTDSAPHSFPTHGDNAAAAGDDSAYDGGGGGTPAGVVKHQRTSSEGSGGGVGIVPPLRLALPNGGGITGGVQTGGDITPLLTARSKYAKQVKESLPVLSARSGSGGGGGLVDLGDPFAVIRRLVKMVELLKDEKQAQEEWRGEGTGLQEEDADDDDGDGSSGDDEDGDGDGGKRKQCRGKAAASTGAPPSTGGGMGVVAALQRDITELRIENANMFLLKEENRVLRAKAAKVDAAELKAASLEKECAELRADLGQASTQLQAMHLQQAMSTAPTTPSSSSSSLHSFAFPNSNGGGGVGSGLPPRRTSATLTQPTSSQQQQQQLLLRHRPGMLQQGAAASALSLHHPHDQEEGGSPSSSSLLPPLLQAPANLPSVSSLTSTSAPLKVAAASGGNPSQQAQHPASAFTDPWACQHSLTQTSSGRPMTAAQVLEECEDELDQEVLQLLAANEQGLKQVRHDLKKAKKEVEREGRQKQQQDGKPSGGASKGSADGASAFTSGSSSSRRQRPDNTGSLSPPSSISRQAKKAPTPHTSCHSSSLAELLSMRRNGGSATPRPSSSSSSSSSPRPETNSNSNSLRSLATSSAKAAADGGADVWTANDDDDDDEEEVDLGADQAEDSDGGGGSLPTNVSSSHALLRRSNASTAETIAAAMVVPPLVLSKTTPYRGSSGGGGGGDDGLGAELVAPSCCPSPRPPRAYSTQIKTSTATSRAAGGGGGSDSRSTVKATAVAPSFVVPPGRMPTTAAAASAGPREDGAAASEARSAATLSRRGGGGDSKTKGSKSERTGKVAPRSNGTFGDVITVHSPRQAALIFDLLN